MRIKKLATFRAITFGEIFTSRLLYVVLLVLAISGVGYFLSNVFSDNSVTRWLLTTDQTQIIADSKISGVKVVGAVNLPKSTRDAQQLYNALKEGLSLSTPIAGFGSEENAAIVGVVGEKTAVPLLGLLHGGTSYRAGASDFGRDDKERPLRYLFSRKEVKAVPSLLYFVGTGSLDGKTVWAYTTDKDAEIDPDAVPVRTQWTVCRLSSCDFDASVLGDQVALEDAVSEAMSGSVRKVLVMSGSYVMTDTLHVSGSGIVISGEGTGSTILVGPNEKDVIGWSSTGGTLSEITIDALSNSSKTAFSAGGVTGVTLDKIRVIGSSDPTAFTVYFAGPSHTQGVAYSEPDSAYTLYTGTGLAEGNSLKDSYIESSLTSDTVVFAFQSGATVSGNDIKGKLAYYLSKNGDIHSNRFHDTPSDSLFISTPVSNLSVHNNTFLNCVSNCINTKPQVEHQMPIGLIADNLSFSGNTFDTAGDFAINISVGADLATPVSFSGVTIDSSSFTNIGKSAAYFTCNFPNSACFWINITNNSAVDTNAGMNGGWWDSAFGLEDYFKTDSGIQNIRHVSIINNSISNTSARNGFGLRFEYPAYELPDYTGNTISGFNYGEKNF